MPCNSVGPKLFWTFQIILVKYQFGRVRFVLHGSNLFWSGPNHFGQVQIVKISSEKSNLSLTKMIWRDLDQTKTI